MKKLFIFIIALIIFDFALAQKPNKEKAQQLLYEAIEKVDNGETEEGIKLLNQAQQLDPDNSTYTYEIAYAQYADKKYGDAIKTLKGILNKKEATFQYYRLLGNCYDDFNQTDKALDVYEAGIKKYPKEGELYFEKGILELNRENYDEAVKYWEQAISADPVFPSSYYWLAKVFSQSEDKVWALMYGELFMNLERNSIRTQEISKLIHDIYKDNIHIDNDTSMSVSLASNIISISDPKKFSIPFPMTYELTVTTGVGICNLAGAKSVDVGMITCIRRTQVDFWFQNEKNVKSYPNILLAYQNQVKEKGYFDAYTHWVLMKGDEDAFDDWFTTHEMEYKLFTDWFLENPLKVSENHFFIRSQYD